MTEIARAEHQQNIPGEREGLLKAVLEYNGIKICEYRERENKLLIYDETLSISEEIPNCREYFLEYQGIHPDDRQKLEDFYRGKRPEELELRILNNGFVRKLQLKTLPMTESGQGEGLPFTVRDITREREQEALLEEQARKDSLTGLFNHFYGQDLINEYLNHKTPYSSCGLMIVDLDYFKYANDTHGHLFGDRVLTGVARLFQAMFEENGIIIRAGGDEFVIFLKDISHSDLLQKAMQLVKAVSRLSFEGTDFSITCSVGVCFLTENESGYTYDQLFENADWALYRAKENGRNCYVFCDNLQRFELAERKLFSEKNIDNRYLHNDIISTAFEIFEKNSSFSAAIETLMEVIGYRFDLDRITVIRTDIREKNTARQYQWRSKMAPEALPENRSFTKEDFLTLFQSYDEHQTMVLQHDNMGMYSPDGAALLMQGEAKTVLYAAMYCEGKYTGAISYVVCREKRHWSPKSRKELGEVTKIISAYLARNQAMNQEDSRRGLWTEYDSLTGLLSFSRFREEAEHMIVGNYADSHVMIYSDIAGFKYFNKKFGYSAGDQLLKEFSAFLMEKMGGALFTRVVADQFLMLAPCDDADGMAERLDGYNKEFERSQSGKFHGARIWIRTGVYPIEPDCSSASSAIDAANYARQQIAGKSGRSVRIYDQSLKEKQQVENEIINGIDKAMEEKRFQIYLQPKISLKDGSVVGAEALVRWKTKEGNVLAPDSFISLCESSGRIEELDYYVFEEVVRFLKRNQQLGRKQVPISINSSILHAYDPQAVRKYLDILNRYGVDPRYTEIELTETATVEEYESAKRLFQELRDAGISTAMDDFGAGYSVLNTVIDIPVDTVKLDRTLVKSCSADGRGAFFLKEIIGMVQGLGYHVVCEGIENRKQFRLLLEAGCEEGQGYLFSMPLSIEDYEKFVYLDEEVDG